MQTEQGPPSSGEPQREPSLECDVRTLTETFHEDVQALVISSLEAVSMVSASCTCRKFHRLALLVAAQRLAEERTGVRADDEEPNLLRRIRSLELYRERIGPRPKGRDWRAEWPALIREEFCSRGYASEAEALGAAHSIDALTQALQVPIGWLDAAGWPENVTTPCSLLGFCGRTALGRALHQRDPAYAASQWLCSTALLERARVQLEPAPPTYRNLSGNGGLEMDDPAWMRLQEVAEATAGSEPMASTGSSSSAAASALHALSFETRSIILTDTHPDCFQSEEGFSVMTWAPSEEGGAALIGYQLQPTSHVVCFQVCARTRGASKRRRTPPAPDLLSLPPNTPGCIFAAEHPRRCLWLPFADPLGRHHVLLSAAGTYPPRVGAAARHLEGARKSHQQDALHGHTHLLLSARLGACPEGARGRALVHVRWTEKR